MDFRPEFIAIATRVAQRTILVLGSSLRRYSREILQEIRDAIRFHGSNVQIVVWMDVYVRTHRLVNFTNELRSLGHVGVIKFQRRVTEIEEEALMALDFEESYNSAEHQKDNEALDYMDHLSILDD